MRSLWALSDFLPEKMRRVNRLWGWSMKVEPELTRRSNWRELTAKYRMGRRKKVVLKGWSAGEALASSTEEGKGRPIMVSV